MGDPIEEPRAPDGHPQSVVPSPTSDEPGRPGGQDHPSSPPSQATHTSAPDAGPNIGQLDAQHAPVLTIPKGAGCWAWGGWSLLTLLLSTALALIVLGGANGTLNFASRGALQDARADLRQLQRRQEAFQAQADALAGQLAELQRQVDALARLRDEVLAVQGRTDALEEKTTQLAQDAQALDAALERWRAQTEALSADLQRVETQLNADMQALTERFEQDAAQLRQQVEEEITAVDQRVDSLSGDIDALQQAAERYNAFLSGLRDLLIAIQEPTSAPASTPPTPSAVQASHPRPSPAASSQTAGASSYQPDRLAGMVWLDEDGDGHPDPSEPPLPGITITVINEIGQIRLLRTDTRGRFQATRMALGTYTVVLQPRRGLVATTPAVLSITLPDQAGERIRFGLQPVAAR